VAALDGRRVTNVRSRRVAGNARPEPIEGWDGHVDAERVKAAGAAIRRLVDACIEKFNDLDDGWIRTIGRDDIAERVGQAIDLAGFEGDEEWLGDRDW